ncbi:MAG TPA: GNAT family N-acetyltransferase [Patescibacteria group bacterium]|nr:GNAT family N-acetyltransferase [Patescibacteria group bacterium]
MNEYKLLKDISISPREAIELYAAIGWGKAADYKEETVSRAFDNTQIFIAAKNEGGKSIGFIRILTDYAFYATIADIVVHPDCQKSDVGRALIEEAKKQLGSTAIFLEAMPQNEEFLKSVVLKSGIWW